MARRAAKLVRGVARLAAALAAVAAMTSCADDIVPPGPAPHVTITGGNGQSGAALDTLALPLEVTVVDDAGEPVAGRAVSWTPADPTGRLVPLNPATDAEGRARAVWLLGFTSGMQTASAVVEGENDPAEFTATAGPVVGFKAIRLMDGTSAGTGEPHMCALAVDSLAWCWGGNFEGQLGDGTNEASALPRQVVGQRRFATIHGERFNTCARTAGGELWCWGRNNWVGNFGGSVFGIGTSESSNVPVRSGGGMLFADFDMERSFACGVTLEGRGYCWGDGDDASGSGATGGSVGTPVELAGDQTWREIAVSDRYRCAISAEHHAYCWMQPDFQRWPHIGVPDDAGPNNVPLLVEIVEALTDLSVGDFGPCGLSLAGSATAVCWGIGATAAPPGPVSHNLGSGVRKVVSDGFARAALDTEGQLWVWPGGCEFGCDWIAGREAPVLLFPGIEWSDVSVANGLHAISARDSVVFSLGTVTDLLDLSSFQLAPVPSP